MATFNKNEIEEIAIKAIEKHSLVKMEQVVSHVPCSSKTFYNYKIQELQSIKQAINKNKVNNKFKLFNKWMDSENATLQIAAYKLMADDEELQALTSSKFDHSNKDGSLKPTNNIITTMTADELKKALEK